MKIGKCKNSIKETMAECVEIVENRRDLGENIIDCAICLQPCIHPAQLPCGHIFCFLCVKGIANQSKKCAMCRQEIPRDFLEQPKLLQVNDEECMSDETLEGGYQWFYEGRNGWWQYDERTSRELETAYKAGERSCELLIAGFLYVADFDSMLQRRRNEPGRRRRIKRDLATIPKKGIAGIKVGHEEQTSVPPETEIINISDDDDDADVVDTDTEDEDLGRIIFYTQRLLG